MRGSDFRIIILVSLVFAVHEWCLRHIFVELKHYTGVNSAVAILVSTQHTVCTIYVIAANVYHHPISEIFHYHVRTPALSHLSHADNT